MPANALAALRLRGAAARAADLVAPAFERVRAAVGGLSISWLPSELDRIEQALAALEKRAGREGFRSSSGKAITPSAALRALSKVFDRAAKHVAGNAALRALMERMVHDVYRLAVAVEDATAAED